MDRLAVALLPPAVLAPDASTSAVPVSDGPVRIEYLAWSAFDPPPAATAPLTVLRPAPASDAAGGREVRS
ncbi:hypothetical protein G3I76_50745 [Streptomyces sp. SID11233]|nr:hypothetical protein [Streptomyces sp. SID11233]